jgi:nitroimidazol reductase NimA-like FMN-containing flavoprotein (pyridoxamine 5'-phosphate oxidase superfamily)
MAYIQKNKNVCFAVCRVPENFGMKNMSYTSVICDGVLEHITAADELTLAVRAGERHLGMPEGAWDGILEKTLQKPELSSFWKIKIKTFGGKRI